MEGLFTLPLCMLYLGKHLQGAIPPDMRIPPFWAFMLMRRFMFMIIQAGWRIGARCQGSLRLYVRTV